MASLISCGDLWKVYQVGEETIEAVAGVSFTIERGEFVAIVGHSGSGKSTLLSMIGGMTRPSRGTVQVDGADVWDGNDAGRAGHRNATFGFVFQFASLIPTLSAIDNILLPALFGSNVDWPKAYARASDLLALVGLAGKRDAFPSELSGGQQRRIAIARALLNDPQVIVADEPTGDLDEATEAEMMALLTRSCRDMRAGLLVVTHSQEIAARADTKLTMKNGRLI